MAGISAVLVELQEVNPAQLARSWTRSRTNHRENRHKCRKTNYDQKCNSGVVMHHPSEIEQATDEH